MLNRHHRTITKLIVRTAPNFNCQLSFFSLLFDLYKQDLDKFCFSRFKPTFWAFAFWGCSCYLELPKEFNRFLCHFHLLSVVSSGSPMRRGPISWPTLVLQACPLCHRKSHGLLISYTSNLESKRHDSIMKIIYGVLKAVFLSSSGCILILSWPLKPFMK